MSRKQQRVSRRLVLRGIGGVALGLPLLESVGGDAAAAPGDPEPFAVFFRQACGVGCAQNTDQIGAEPERFWPREEGALTEASVAGRALDELGPYLPQTLLLRVNKHNFDNYADGHANGAQQSLTGRGPTPATAGSGGNTEADGESLDHRIGKDLNPGGRDSLYLYAGPEQGWLGGACLSYRSAGQRRAAERVPFNAYQTLTGGNTQLDPALAQRIKDRQTSVNDLVSSQLRQLISSPSTGSADRERLDLHLTAVRELELSLTCQLQQQDVLKLETGSQVFDEMDHDSIMQTARLHAEVAALAIACGYTRSALIQVGDGNSAPLRFRNPETGNLMDNYHFISHRINSHGGEGDVIAGSDLLHHYIDRYHAQLFRHLLDRLNAYVMPDGKTLLSHGVATWFNDNGNGPAHSIKGVPYALVGSCNGRLKQGQYVALEGEENLCQVLGTLGTAVGVTAADGGPLVDFGDPTLTRGIRSEMLA